MDMAEAAFEHDTTEIGVVSSALEELHEANQLRLNALLRSHPEIVAEADAEFFRRTTSSVSICSPQHEVPVRSRKNNRARGRLTREA